ncbi:MAG: hypothetical protein QOE72_1919 [Chloroflexota bacterium]|jgi:hypothetical protein|nr:hypothetical protein [Chloroflexota bacterium]
MIKHISTLAATSTMVLGLAAAGAMGTTTAFAGGGGGGGTPTFECVNAPLEVLKVECISIPITFETSVDHVLNGNELNVLSGDLNGNTILSHDLNDVSILNGALSHNQVDVNILTLDVSKALNVNICSVAIDIAGIDLTNTVCL